MKKYLKTSQFWPGFRIPVLFQLVSVLTWVGIASALAEEPINRAYDDLIEARKKYYQELKKSPNASTEQKKAIEQRTISPAIRGVDRAIEQSLEHTLRTNKVTVSNVDDGPKRDRTLKPNSKFGKWREALKKQKGKKGLAGGSTSPVPYKKGKGPLADQDTASKPEEVLDGKGVPKSLSFPGKKKSP